MPHLSKITIYPIKSLDGMDVAAATVLPSGALQYDRRFALTDEKGLIVNGKRTPAIHQLRSRFDEVTRTIWLKSLLTESSFRIDEERSEMEAWLSEYFGFGVFWIEDEKIGFPDDLDASGPTLVSQASLDAVSSWFEELSGLESHRRFRTNLVVAGVSAFWEDQWVGETGRPVPFQIGDVELMGVNPCQRCIVPTRQSQTGEVLHGFSKRFRERREATLPEWAPRGRFDHFYRFALNTRIPASQAGKTLRVGDDITVLR